MACALAGVLALATRGAAAQDDPGGYGAVAAPPEDPGYEATARVEVTPSEDGGRARAVVTRAQLEERLPRSAPDALRWVPGVSVQQSAHGQASPYVRGLTGQQVVHVFDGVRMNNGIYRQGPNQYFFTVDSRTVDRLEVVRGSASVRYGADALGGAILAIPREPLVEGRPGFAARPRAELRYGSADRELGGRGEVELSLGARTALTLGGGYRDVDRLRSGGVVEHRSPSGDPDAPRTRADVLPWTPRFEEELDGRGLDDRGRWRTQLGTGFREATFDARVVHALGDRLRAVSAVYGYRQSDAPRTDKCPPPEAPIDECLTVAEQFRTLALARLAGEAGPLRDLSLTLSFQRHHEVRVNERPRSRVRFDATDDVDTLGIAVSARTPGGALGERGRFFVRYGAEAYRDGVSSRRSQTFTDIARTSEESRGQYLDGSSYLTAGAFAEAELSPVRWLTARAGGRLSAVGVRAPGDPESGTSAVHREFGAAVGRAGVEVRLGAPLSITANVDQGFRAPNLDDLTSRQQTGPGFQFENARLSPERSTTWELGVHGRGAAIEVDGWIYATSIRDAIQRVTRESADCPPATAQCQSSRNQLQLVNLDGRARVFGAEAGLTAFLPAEVTLRATVAQAWGDGPSPAGRGATGALREPLSRVPPLNGTAEARWRHLETGVYAAAGLQWAAPQTRLAATDRSDARIPLGGTPGWAIVELRAGYRWGARLAVAAVLDNLFDAAYRVHGSSIDGPGRGIRLNVSGGL